MILKTKNLAVEITLNNRNVVRILDMLETDDLKNVLFAGLKKLNIKTYATFILCTVENNVLKTFPEVLDFIDAYKTENEKTLKDMYIELIKEFNDKYFFTSKMTAEELQSEIDNPISNIDLDEIARGVVEKMAAETILNTPQGRSLTTPAS